MPLPTLSLPPDQSGYQAAFGVTGVSTQLEGGASRFRADQLGAAFQITVQWTVNKANAAYLTAFFRNAINFGALPFIVGLYADDGEIRDYTCHFMPGTFNLVSQSGATWVYGATLEALPDDSYYVNDATIVAAGPDV